MPKEIVLELTRVIGIFFPSLTGALTLWVINLSPLIMDQSVYHTEEDLLFKLYGYIHKGYLK